MLMHHENFPFKQIPEKTNYMIFLKSPKTIFLGHFWPFLVIFAQWGFFSKRSSSVTLNYIWVPNNKFQKKLMSQSRENLRTDGRTEGRTDRPDFIGPFRSRPGLQKRVFTWHNLYIIKGSFLNQSCKISTFNLDPCYFRFFHKDQYDTSTYR